MVSPRFALCARNERIVVHAAVHMNENPIRVNADDEERSYQFS